MLSGEGDAGEQWKTTIGLISKKATLLVHHTFFVHFFAVVFHDYNVKLAETSYSHVLLRKCRTFSRSLFSHCRSFSPCIGDRWHFSFCHRRFRWKKIPTKKCLLCFSSLALDLCLPISRWASLACRLLSLFLCLSLALYSKFVVMTIILSLIL